MRSDEAAPRTARLAIVGAAAVAAYAAAVLAAWLSGHGHGWLVAPLGDGRAIRPNCALGFLLAASSLVLASGDQPRARLAGRALALVLLGLGVATAFEHLSGIDLGLDDLLATARPARPAHLTAAGMITLGGALLAIDVPPRRGVAISELLAVATGAIGGLIVVAYAFDYAYLQGAVGLEGTVSLPVALCFAVLGAGVLLARADRGLTAELASPYVGGAMARRMIVGAIVALPATAAVSIGLQRAGLYPAPGAAVIDTVLMLVAFLVAIAVLARASNKSDATRSRLEDELRRWKRFFDDAAFGAVFAQPDGTILDVNPAFARMHGVTRAALLGHKVDEHISAEAHAVFARARTRIEATGNARFEAEHARPDGTTFPVVVDASLVRDADGRPLYRLAYVQDITEERRAAATRARLAAAVASADDAIIATDLAGVVVAWNRGAERTYGYAADEILGKSFMTLVPPERHGLRDEAIARLRAGEVLREERTERVAKDGRLVPASVTLSPIVDDEGRAVGFSAIERDISAQLAAEAAVAAAHRRLERVVIASHAVTDAVTQLPSVGLRRVLEVVAEQAKLLTGADYASVQLDAQPAGAPPSAALGTPPSRRTGTSGEWAVPGDAADPDVIDAPVLFRGERRGSIVLVGKEQAGFTEGDHRAVEMLAADLGAALEVAVLYDRESLQRGWLESVMAQMPEAVAVFDGDGRVVLENDKSRGLALVRVPAPGTGIQVPTNVCTPAGEPLPLTEQPTPRALAGEVVLGVELAIRGADGALAPVLVSAAPVRRDGAIAGAVAVTRDIRMLKELERLREEWSSVIAHDLRQPVNGIRLAAELLERAPLEAKHKRWAERIRADALRLNAMIQDLLDSSRLEANRLALQIETTRLDEAVDAAAARLPELADRLRVEIAPAASRVLADPGRLLQVVGNLLSNAVKYGRDGAPIAVAAARDGARARISVTNHGAGIAAEDVPRLFDRFARTRAASQSKVEGIGLGLYLSKGLVEAQRGRIWVESTPGETTTFTFTLPLPPDAIEAPDAAAPSEQADVTSSPAAAAPSPTPASTPDAPPPTARAAG